MGHKAFILFSIILMLFACVSLSALSFDTKLTGITTHPDFWLGMFPSSVRCFAGLDGLEFIPGRLTEAGVEIATGTIARTLSQDPVTGTVIGDSSASELKDNRYYDVTYAAWKIGVAQGVGWSRLADFDLVTLRFTIDGQWEVALDPLMQVASRSGYPFRNIEAFSNAVPGEVLPGTPDLSGNRQLLSTSFDLYGKLSDRLFSTGFLDGLSVEFKFVWAPAFMTFSKGYGGYADYWKIWTYTQFGKMIHQKKDAEGNNKWSIGISNELEMRILGGEYVPEYARTLKSHIWWYEPENMTFIAKNTFRINYYGQQFFGDCIPYIYFFLDLNYSGGKLNNYKLDEKIASVWEGSFGVHVELQLFSMFHIYYEIGRVFMYTGDKEGVKGLQYSKTVRITVSLPGGDGADWSN